LTVFDFIAVKLTYKALKVSFESNLVKLDHLAGHHVYTLFPECIENHAVSLALLLIYIDFDRKVLKKV
jgi:hypothetical protein